MHRASTPTVTSRATRSRRSTATYGRDYNEDEGSGVLDAGTRTGTDTSGTTQRGGPGTDTGGPNTDDAMTRSEEELRVGTVER
jgi:hypothetical protein